MDEAPPVNTRGLATALEDPTLLMAQYVETYRQVSALLSVNHEQLPSFHHDYVKRLGRNSVVDSDLCVEIKPR